MRFCAAAFVAALLAVVFASSQVNAWHVVAPIIAPVVAPKAPSGPGVVGGGGGAGPGAAMVGGFIGAVAVVIIVHEIMGPSCAKRGNKHGYDQPRFWRPLCKHRRHHKPIAVRG